MKIGFSDSGPAARPFGNLKSADLESRCARALDAADGLTAAHCLHELWMRGGIGANIERWLKRLWALPADSIPEWVPMHYVEWLPAVYEIAARFNSSGKGRSNIYLVLLDYRDRLYDTPCAEPYGIYVGMTQYPPMERFDQHKAGIRAAGAVLKRGLEMLVGPVMHLQHIKRSEAERIEVQLAEVLAASGLRVKGGH